MPTPVSIDPSTTTALSYWLNWRVFVCAIWVLGSMLVASILIWKYERLNNYVVGGNKYYCNRSWKPCLNNIHPIFLMIYRVLALCLLLVSLSFDVTLHGAELFHYYTQWTFTLASIYFLLGSFLSIHGCYGLLREKKYSGEDTEQGSYKAKLLQDKANEPGFWDFLFRVLFQICAGAATLTDVVYWCVIFPFLSIRDYEINFLTALTHSLNLVLLLGDAAFNSLQLQWYGISYFLLWTGSYVIFEWLIHACINLWWAYPFLDLSMPYAPLWYLVVAVLHVPCYALFLMVVRAKYLILSRWFPRFDQRLS